MEFRSLLLSLLCLLIGLPCHALQPEKDRLPFHEKKGVHGQGNITKIRPYSGPVLQKGVPGISSGTFKIESGSISFSNLIPGHDKDLPGSVAIRVFSQGNWRLRIFAGSLQVLHHTEKAPISRLKIRSRATSGFMPFEEGRPILMAQGTKTNPAGNLILADLRLRLEDQDPVGIYSSQIRIILELD